METTRSKIKIASFLIVLLFSIGSSGVYAQFNWGGQLIQRGEYRHGYGKLILEGVDPAVFINQRLRLESNYHGKSFQFFASIQDIRVWGNTSQTNVTDGLLSLHEAWTEIKLDTSWQLKLGRQELNYDNARFLGNLDWAMQARSHDFALVKYAKNSHKLHIGAGFNQDSEKLTGNEFKNNNQYKSALMAWYNFQKNNFEISLLFWNNTKQYLKYDSTGIIINQSSRSSQTFGVPRLNLKIKKGLLLSAFGYYQLGKDVLDKNYNAYDIDFNIAKTIDVNSEKKSTLKCSLGMEMLSGTNSNNKENVNNSFTPMYGTNHMHNGYMDYFFVGGRFENSVGLNDLFLQLKYESKKRWFIGIDIHDFRSNANVYNMNVLLSNKLGSEIDFTSGLIINDDISLQAGYSQMFANSTLKFLQGKNSSSMQNWAYLMLIIRPKSNKKFIGILN